MNTGNNISKIYSLKEDAFPLKAIKKKEGGSLLQRVPKFELNEENPYILTFLKEKVMKISTVLMSALASDSEFFHGLFKYRQGSKDDPSGSPVFSLKVDKKLFKTFLIHQSSQMLD